MYCRNCNAYNDDNSRFCSQCGSELENETQQSAQAENGYTDQYSQSQYSQSQYSQPQYSNVQNQQPYYNKPVSSFNNTMSIIALVLNIAIFNVIGLIFAILSLTNYNSYESAFRAGNLALAEQLQAKSKRYSKIAIVVAIVVAVIYVIAIVAGIMMFFFRPDIADYEVYPEFYNQFDTFAQIGPVLTF